MKLIAKKPCGFGGKRFYIGDEIPAEFVLDPKTQEKMGVLTIISEDAAAPAPVDPAAATINVVVRPETGDIPLTLTQDGLQAVVDVLAGNADDAAPIIEGITDPDALILLNELDSRKTVKTAVEARAQALQEDESEGDQ